jgi:hypothetical protein
LIDWLVNIGDGIFGWALWLGPLGAVAVLATVTSAAMIAVRRVATDQDLLARCAADRKVLKRSIRQSRRQKDRQAVKRKRRTFTQVQVKMLGAEMLPLLISLPLIGLIGLWGYQRLMYHPPQPGDAVTVELSLPPTAVGRLVSLIPSPGLSADGWIQRVEKGPGDPPHGLVRWTVSGQGREQPYKLTIRYRGRQFEHPLRFGGRFYAQPVRQHDPRFLLPQTALRMEPVALPAGIPWFAPETMTGTIVPAWMVLYVVLVIPLFLLGRRLVGIR